MKPDGAAYIAVMEEIKRRTAVVFALQGKQIQMPHRIIQAEAMVLQVRMILELIALASLAANKPLFEASQKKFEKHWQVVKILADVEKLNADFYPKPVVELPSSTPGVKSELDAVKSGFMTRDELVEVHGRCGGLLHARNPYGKGIDLAAYEKAVPRWMERIMKLLNCHQIKLLDGSTFHLVHMKEDQDEKVHMYTFQKTSAQPAVAADRGDGRRSR